MYLRPYQEMGLTPLVPGGVISEFLNSLLKYANISCGVIQDTLYTVGKYTCSILVMRMRLCNKLTYKEVGERPVIVLSPGELERQFPQPQCGMKHNHIVKYGQPLWSGAGCYQVSRHAAQTVEYVASKGQWRVEDDLVS